jgi:hypothetical protein
MIKIVGNIGKRERFNRGFYANKTRVFLFPKGETILEQFTVGRHTRPYTQYRKEVLPIVLKRLGLPKGTKVSWSQRAGCSCPCSPGFIIQNGAYGYDVFVDVAVEEAA